MTNAFDAAFANPEEHKAPASFTPMPIIQVLNDANEANCGLFMTQESAQLAGFVPDENWLPHTTIFKSNPTEPVQGYISRKVCLTIVRATRLTMFQAIQGQRDKLIGDYDADYRNQNYASTRLKRRYYVYIRNAATGDALSTRPFIMTLGGSFSAAFGAALQDYRKEVEKVTNTVGMNDFFHSCCMFKFIIQPKLKGVPPQSNFVADIFAWVKPDDGFQPTAEMNTPELVAKARADYFKATSALKTTDQLLKAQTDNVASETFDWGNSDPIFSPKAEEEVVDAFVTPAAAVAAQAPAPVAAPAPAAPVYTQPPAQAQPQPVYAQPPAAQPVAAPVYAQPPAQAAPQPPAPAVVPAQAPVAAPPVNANQW